jgi:predicted ATPase
MWIKSFQIENYKSFYSTSEIPLDRGMNVVVGKNNAGKTALMEALSLAFSSNIPHLSLVTVPNPSAAPASQASRVNFEISIAPDEFSGYILSQSPFFHVPLDLNFPQNEQISKVRSLFAGDISLSCTYTPQSLSSVRLVGLPEVPNTDRTMRFQLTDRKTPPTFATQVLEINRRNSGEQTILQFASSLAAYFRSLVYAFKAERRINDTFPVNADLNLMTDASNLAQVLNHLMTRDTYGFEQYTNLVREVFPEITQVTTPPTPTPPGSVQIRISTLATTLRRTDLSLPLSASGTGIGQMLAMLYVIFTSDASRTILIDEPQSFLHPAAIRRLFQILKRYQQHQYVISTHSPNVISSSGADSVVLLRKGEAESKTDILDRRANSNMRLFLSEVGAKLSDVFGADNVLWVEGETEEICFPKIIEKFLPSGMSSTSIIGVRSTGELESKDAERIYEIYMKLTRGPSLLPPALGFIFDKEGRDQRTQDDLNRQSGGKVRFLDRRMFENYLIHPPAIAAIASSLEGFDPEEVTQIAVQDWIEGRKWDLTYLGSNVMEVDRNDTYWIRNVNGAKLLYDLFNSLSHTRTIYRKTEHGALLIDWILKNAPQLLEEISRLLSTVLGP